MDCQKRSLLGVRDSRLSKVVLTATEQTGLLDRIMARRQLKKHGSCALPSAESCKQAAG